MHVDEQREGFFHFDSFVKTYGLSEEEQEHHADIDAQEFRQLCTIPEVCQIAAADMETI